MLAPFPQGSTNSAAAFTACVGAGLSSTRKLSDDVAEDRCYARHMSDDDKPARPFPIEVVVNGVKVTVTLMLKPGVTVEVSPPATRRCGAR